MNPTPQQQAVFDAITATTRNLCVEAVAGAGKTAVSVESARRARNGKVGFVAFNQHIARELQHRLGDEATASTLHSLGMRAIRKRHPRAELDERKPERLLQQLKPKWFWKGRDDSWRPTDEAKTVIQLARLCKYTLTDASCIEDLDALVEHHSLDLLGFTEALYLATAELLDEAAKDVDTFDFDDMVWLPTRLDLDAGCYSLLFCDEVQDFNKAQQALARRAGKRIVIVGDSSQAIYGFSGSDCDALKKFRQELEGEDRPLTVTFRCPTTHVEMARRIVPAIEPASGCVEGVVSCCDPEQVFREVMPGDLVISRCNAPLVGLAYRLIIAGIPTLMRGRDIGKGITDLINMLKPESTADLGKKLRSYHKRERERLKRKRAADSAIQSLDDRVEALDVLCGRFATLEELRTFIADLFADETDAGKVILSSIHRAKGLEADRVVIIAPEKLPLIRKDSKPWEIVQESNLCYIAVTRAKKEIIFAGPVPEVFGNIRLSKSMF